MQYRVVSKGTGSFITIVDGKRGFRKWLEKNGKYNELWTEDNLELQEIKVSKKAKHTLYDNYDVISDENMQAERENFIENGWTDITDDMLYQACYDTSSLWWENGKLELDSIDEGEVIAIANLGLWDGRRTGYKELNCLSDIMYTNCDYMSVYVDGNGDLWKEESHHDGSNSILYRYWKDNISDTQKENFKEKLYNGTYTIKDISRYTRKAGLSVARLYGWKVRGI